MLLRAQKPRCNRRALVFVHPLVHLVILHTKNYWFDHYSTRFILFYYFTFCIHTKICPFPGNETTLGSKPLCSFSLSGRTLDQFGEEEKLEKLFNEIHVDCIQTHQFHSIHWKHCIIEIIKLINLYNKCSICDSVK